MGPSSSGSSIATGVTTSIATGSAKVFLVDDEAIVRRAIGRILRIHGFDVEAFPSGPAFLARPAHDGPACVILDQRMSERSGLEVQAALAARPESAGWVIVFLTAHGDIPMSVRAMKGGAFDVLTKPSDPALLVQVVSRAIEEATGRHAAVRADVGFRSRLAQLTTRERQVCALILSGYLNKQAAGVLGIVEKTVKIHRANAMRRLGVGSVAELARLVERSGTRAILQAALPTPPQRPT